MRFGLTRWNPSSVDRMDPFEEMRSMQDRLNQLFGEGETGGGWMDIDTFRPLADIKEKENNIIVTTDLPGIEKKDVNIDIKGNRLWISANTQRENEEEKEGYLMKERSFKRFARSLSLPASVTEQGSTAKMEDGVLTITLPKAEEEEKHKIMIE
jgi:HSP20 family protein